MKTRMNSMRAFAMTVACAIGLSAFSAGAVRAADAIDPRLYLPEIKKDESMFVAVVKAPELLKLDAVKQFRKEHKLDEEIAKEIANVTLDDLAELVIVGVGTPEGASKTVGLIRFTKDLEVKDMLKDPKKLGEAKKVAGYEVYEIKEEDETTRLIKVAPSTFAVTGDMSEKAMASYLKTISAKTPAKYPEAVAALLKGMDGDVVFAGNNIPKNEEDTLGFAMSVKVGDTTKFSAAMKFQSEEAAQASAEKIKESGDSPVAMIPNSKIVADGTLVKITGSATKDEIKKMVDGLGKQLPFGGEDEGEMEVMPSPEGPMK